MKLLYQKLGRILYTLSIPALWLVIGRQLRAYVLIECGDEILLGRNWFGDGRWSLPGGGLHRHELSVDGAVREVMEETALVLDRQRLNFLDRNSRRFWLSRKNYELFSYRFETKPEFSRDKKELIGLEWINRAQLKKLAVVPEVDQALQLGAKK